MTNSTPQNAIVVNNLDLRFGGLTALKSVCANFCAGAVTAVIGPNGAGKTSLFNVITGLYEPSAGDVFFFGREVRRPFRLRTFLGIFLIAFCTGLGLLLAINLESLWEAVITGNYSYRQPFPWGQALRGIPCYFVGQDFWSGWFPFLLGFVLSAWGSSLVWLRGRRTPDVVARHGLGRTFQNIRLFQQMSVLENALVGTESKLPVRFLDAAFRLPRYFREQRLALAKAHEVLAFVGLSELSHERAANLSYGSQRRLEIARALAMQPQVLLLDEPAAGMNPAEGQELVALIRKIKERGVTVILIEHHMKVVMNISDHIIVLDYGNKIAEGSPEQVKCNRCVIEAYLGSAELH